MKRNYLWYLCILAALVLVVMTFTPLVTPAHKYKPELFGLPYTLWTGMLVSILLVMVTIASAFTHPGSKRNDI